MASRLKLIVAYDGGGFAGWQSQLNRNGVQDHLETAFANVVGERVPVHGAGRTDAGVHALGQCAHADLPVRRYNADRWRSALNGLLPPTIRIVRCRFVADSFHARFSAKGKIYRYRIWNGDVLPPLEYGRAWHVRQPLDFDCMVRAGKFFVGRHDFSSFAANRGAPVEDACRTLRRVHLRRAGPLVTIEFDGDGFLYKMARLMAGALVHAGSGKTSPQEIATRLRQASRRVTQAREVAPAGGLFLVRVRY